MTIRFTIVGLGEILWDLFPDGPRFGGAPANFACSAASLGGDDVAVFVASAVGRDDLGDRAIEALQQRGVETSHVARPDSPTGTVNVEIDAAGHASYVFDDDTAWDSMKWSPDWQDLAVHTDIVCFGTLGQRSESSRETIQRFVRTTPATALRIFDVNLRPPFWSEAVILESLELANVLKLNDEELPVVAELCSLTGMDADLLRQLAERFELSAVALTRGAGGALLVRGDEMADCAGISTTVVDTVGAGDAFTAALALGLSNGDDLDAINRRACDVAAFVCSQAGATPVFPDRP